MGSQAPTSVDYGKFFQGSSFNRERVVSPAGILVCYRYPFVGGLIEPSLFPLARCRECVLDSVVDRFGFIPVAGSGLKPGFAAVARRFARRPQRVGTFCLAGTRHALADPEHAANPSGAPSVVAELRPNLLDEALRQCGVTNQKL